MNRFMSKGLGAGILILGLATTPLALPASAQNADSNRPALDTTPLQETKNDFNNFGWLGLIGLVGLVKLFRKSRQPEPQPERQPEPYVGNPSGYRAPDSVHPSTYADSDAVGRSPADPDGGSPSGYRAPGSAHPSSYGDSDAVGRSYTDPDEENRAKRQ